MDPFTQAYLDGRTPNPCIRCNEAIKFGLLLQKALALGADAVATGHYARVHGGSDGYHLLKAADARKDQSYVLYQLGQRELGLVRFPVGGMQKQEVRERARARGCASARQPEGPEVGLIAVRDHRPLLQDPLAART